MRSHRYALGARKLEALLNSNMIYKFIGVRESTHKRLKLLAVEEEKTFDQLLNVLMDSK